MQIKIEIQENSKSFVISCDDKNIIKDVLDLLIKKDLISNEYSKVTSNRFDVILDINNSFRNNLVQSGDVIYVCNV